MSLIKHIFKLFFLLLFCSGAAAQTFSIYCEEVPPLQYYDNSKNLTGFTVELMRALQQQVGNSDPIQVVPWARGIYIISKQANTLLFSMARTPERESLYQWIGPIASISYGLYAKTNSPIKLTTLEEAKKIKLIGVYRNDIADETLTRLGFQNLDRAASNISSFKKLMVGRVDAIADSKISIEALALASDYQTNDVKQIYELATIQSYIAASKDIDPAIIAKWNEALKTIKKDRSYSELKKKYLMQ